MIYPKIGRRDKIKAAAENFRHYTPGTSSELRDFAISQVNEALEEAAQAIERLDTAVPYYSMVIRSFKVTP